MYAPNQVRARNEFFEFCCDFIDPGIPTVVCVDFNTVIDRSTDRRGSDPLDSSRESSLAPPPVVCQIFGGTCTH